MRTPHHGRAQPHSEILGSGNRPSLTLVHADDSVCSPLETCDGMLEDLDREIASTKLDEKASAYPIRSLAFTKRDGTYFIYELRVARRLPHLRGESAVILRIDETTLLPTQVVAAASYKVSLASTVQLPLPVPLGACVVIDDSWLLERQRSRLASLRESVAKGIDADIANVDLAQLIVGEGNFDAKEPLQKS
jgi:hypothetical protein